MFAFDLDIFSDGFSFPFGVSSLQPAEGSLHPGVSKNEKPLYAAQNSGARIVRTSTKRTPILWKKAKCMQGPFTQAA